MGQRRIISEMRKRGVSEEIIQGRINAHKAKAEANIAREIIYLQLIRENSGKENRHMRIVNLSKQVNVNHVTNARDVFVKNILQKRRVNNSRLINNSINL